MQVGIIGYLGKMGQELLRCIEENDDTCVYKKDQDNEILQVHPDCLLDFSIPEAIASSCKKALVFQCPLVVGTTGLGNQHVEMLEKTSKSVPVFYSTNYSLGIHCLHTMLASIQKQLKDWDVGIMETHHTEKKDAPSGTALSLQKTLARNCPIQSFRLKGVPGEHQIMITNQNETIHIKHTAYSRKVFASGALDCARWLLSHKYENGFFTMNSRFKGEQNETNNTTNH
ncbi:MAG: dihydrodipicolinate reductase C-terminal domain-containing protein [Caldisericia bacterium]|nr:dihydrodipicolinate reductase C-terminal domain-containing protein [Caldisericia bacterium]